MLFESVLVNNASIFNFSIKVNSKGDLYPNFIEEVKKKDGSSILDAVNDKFYQSMSDGIIFSSDSILRKPHITNVYEES